MEGFNFDSVIAKVNVAINILSIEVAAKVAADTVNNFNSESFGGSNWIPTKNIGEGKILNKTGKLKEAARKSNTTGRRIKNGYVLVVDNEYGIYHQDGVGKLPQRQFIGIDNELNNRIMNDISSLIDKCFK